MKKLYLSFIALSSFFIISCEVYQSGMYLKPQQASITNIPLQPHEMPVDVFLGTEKPAKPYYRVKLVEITARPGTSADDMLNLLRKEAQIQGIDAIILDDIGRQLSNTNNVPTNDGVYTFQKLVGLGLKYRERMNHVASILKEQQVRLWKDSLPEPKEFQMRFDMAGTPLSFSDTFIHKFFHSEIYPFEAHNSIYSPMNNWEYRLDSLTNIFSKRRADNVWMTIKSDFTINMGKPLAGTITMFDDFERASAKYLLEYEYNNNDVPVKRTLKNKKTNAVIWEDAFSYYHSGKPFKTERSIMINGKMQPYFEIRNEYFKLEDLPATEN
jgi:hypothetical protein